MHQTETPPVRHSTLCRPVRRTTRAAAVAWNPTAAGRTSVGEFYFLVDILDQGLSTYVWSFPSRIRFNFQSGTKTRPETPLKIEIQLHPSRDGWKWLRIAGEPVAHDLDRKSPIGYQQQPVTHSFPAAILSLETPNTSQSTLFRRGHTLPFS